MSTGGSGSGVTRRQLKRAEEGWRLFEAAAGTRAAAVGNMMAAGDVHNALATTEAQEKWGRIADKAVREIGEAVEIMRCGMPYNAKDVSSACIVYGSVERDIIEPTNTFLRY